MTIPLDTLKIDGQKLDVDVAKSVLPGSEIVRTMTGASSVTLYLHDPDGKIRRSGVLTRPGTRPLKNFKQAPWKERIGKTTLEITPAAPRRRDGEPDRRFKASKPLRFRLAGVKKSRKTLILTFEDEIAALLRQHSRALRASRADMTRAEFVIQMLREVKERRIEYVVTNPGKHQPIVDVDEDDGSKARDRGISAAAARRLTIAGSQINDEQRRNLNTVLGVAVELEAPELATLAMLCANIGESQAKTAITNPRSGAKGVFQILPKYWHIISWDDVAGGARVFLIQGFTRLGSSPASLIVPGVGGALPSGYAGAIQLARADGDLRPGDIASRVEGSDANGDFYQRNLNEAQAILEAYGGVNRSETVRESFNYYRGDPNDPDSTEDTWDCTGRLGREVTWPRFASENVFYFVTDQDLFKSQPRMTINEATAGVHWIDYDVDYGKPVQTVTVDCRADLWIAPPGSVTEIADEDDLVDGRWLVDTIRQKLQRSDTTIELRRPKLAKPEPAPNTHTTTFSDQDTSGTRGDILEQANKALAQANRYSYLQTRPMPSSLFSRPGDLLPGGILLIDCSAFATLAYKAAGVKDPNGFGYNGSGNTSTLRAQGRRTDDPQPGDLVHFGSGAAGGASHVGIYVGRENGKAMMIDMSSSRGLSKREIWMTGSPAFAGYWTYDLSGD